jgi:hypothetical protein
LEQQFPVAVPKPYSDKFVAEYKTHVQCSLEIKVALDDKEGRSQMGWKLVVNISV